MIGPNLLNAIAIAPNFQKGARHNNLQFFKIVRYRPPVTNLDTNAPGILGAQDPLQPQDGKWERAAADILLSDRNVSTAEVAGLLEG